MVGRDPDPWCTSPLLTKPTASFTCMHAGIPCISQPDQPPSGLSHLPHIIRAAGQPASQSCHDKLLQPETPSSHHEPCHEWSTAALYFGSIQYLYQYPVTAFQAPLRCEHHGAATSYKLGPYHQDSLTSKGRSLHRAPKEEARAHLQPRHRSSLTRRCMTTAPRICPAKTT